MKLNLKLFYLLACLFVCCLSIYFIVDIIQLVTRFPNKHEALNSNPRACVKAPGLVVSV